MSGTLRRWSAPVAALVVLVALPSAAGAAGYVAEGPYATGHAEVVAGTFHRGGLPDLATAPDGVWTNDGHGGFTAPASPPAAPWTPIAAADFNGDGVDDLATATGQTIFQSPDWKPPAPSATVALGRGDGTFDAPVTLPAMPPPDDGELPPVMRVFAQPITDGDTPDLMVITRLPARLNVYPGHGDGTFGALRTTAIPSMNAWHGGIYPWFGDLFRAVAVGDLDGDGHRDMAVGLDGGEKLQIMLGRGDGGFDVGPVIEGLVDTTRAWYANEHCCTDVAFRGLAAVDADGDGDLDLAVAQGEEYTGIRLLVNDGHGHFNVGSLPGDGSDDVQAPDDVQAADLDGDGRPDLLTTGPRWLRGHGDGTFDPAHRLLCPGVTTGWVRGVQTSDVDGDGRPDLLVAASTPGDGGGEVTEVLRADAHAPACDTGGDVPAVLDPRIEQLPASRPADGGQVCFSATIDGRGLPTTATVSTFSWGGPGTTTRSLGPDGRLCVWLRPDVGFWWWIDAQNAVGWTTTSERTFAPVVWSTTPPVLSLEDPIPDPADPRSVTLRGTVTPTGPRSQFRFEVAGDPAFSSHAERYGILDTPDANAAAPMPITTEIRLAPGTYYVRLRGWRSPEYTAPAQEWTTAGRAFIVSDAPAPAATTTAEPSATAPATAVPPAAAVDGTSSASATPAPSTEPRPPVLAVPGPTVRCAVVRGSERRRARCLVVLPATPSPPRVRLVLLRHGRLLASARAPVGRDRRATVLLVSRRRLPAGAVLELVAVYDGRAHPLTVVVR
jgi:hypothetical protein